MKYCILLACIFFLNCTVVDNFLDDDQASYEISGIESSQISIGETVGLVIFSKREDSLECQENRDMQALVKRTGPNTVPDYSSHQYDNYETYGHQTYEGGDTIIFRYPLPNSLEDQDLLSFHRYGVFVGMYVERSNNKTLDRGDMVFLNQARDGTISEDALGYEIITVCYDHLFFGGLERSEKINLGEYQLGELALDVSLYFAATPIFLWNSSVVSSGQFEKAGFPAPRRTREGQKSVLESICRTSDIPEFSKGDNADMVINYIAMGSNATGVTVKNDFVSNFPIPHKNSRYVIGRLDKSLNDPTYGYDNILERVAFRGWGEIRLNRNLIPGATFASTQIFVNRNDSERNRRGELNSGRATNPLFSIGDVDSRGRNNCKNWTDDGGRFEGGTRGGDRSFRSATIPSRGDDINCIDRRTWLCVTYE